MEALARFLFDHSYDYWNKISHLVKRVSISSGVRLPDDYFARILHVAVQPVLYRYRYYDHRENASHFRWLEHNNIELREAASNPLMLNHLKWNSSYLTWDVLIYLRSSPMISNSVSKVGILDGASWSSCFFIWNESIFNPLCRVAFRNVSFVASQIRKSISPFIRSMMRSMTSSDLRWPFLTFPHESEDLWRISFPNEIKILSKK